MLLIFLDSYCVIRCGSCIIVYGDCSCGNSRIGGGGLQYGGQISSLIILSSLLLSNIGYNGDDGLCSTSSCANTFSNTVNIPEIIANTIKDVYTIKFKNEIIVYFVYQII
jgi:hypothetical protein